MDEFLRPPTDINPYDVLELYVTATPVEVKSAYKKLALRHHPDKARPDAKDEAHAKFQEIAFAYAILSDERRRKRYDLTGNTSESLHLEDDDFNWTDFFRAQWADAVTSTKIDSFKERYQGSDEEKNDVLTSYTQAQGKLNAVYSQVMLSNPLHDEDRFRIYIDQAIRDGEVEEYDAYTKETQKQKNARLRKAERDGKEAEEHAKSLGKYDAIFGDVSGSKSKKQGPKKDNGPDLAGMIQQRQKGRAEAFLDDLELRYASPKKASSNGQNGTKKRKFEEPPEELFQKNRSKKPKVGKPEIDDDQDEEMMDLANDDGAFVSGYEEDDEDGRKMKKKNAAKKVNGKPKQKVSGYEEDDEDSREMEKKKKNAANGMNGKPKQKETKKKKGIARKK